MMKNTIDSSSGQLRSSLYTAVNWVFSRVYLAASVTRRWCKVYIYIYMCIRLPLLLLLLLRSWHLVWYGLMSGGDRYREQKTESVK